MPSAQPSLIGATIGNYRVESKLGEGGMGTVYLAEHPLIGKRVALKVLHPEMAHNEELVSRFFNEARAVNEIGHPNIVDVVDYGVLEQDGRPAVVYFIMELLTGEPLSAVLAREAPLPPERALRIAIQVGDALGASHRKGVIHRDLKPDNVFLTQRGRESDFVKVLDFGIAKLTAGAAGGELSRTRTGVVMGTPAYMSPEQCEGKRGMDTRTDIYSLGVLLFEMVTGRVPFLGEGYGEVILQHMTHPPPRPSSLQAGIPRAVEAVIMKALEKKRERRFGSMEQMVAALRDPERFILDEGPYTDAPSTRASTVPERKSRVADAFSATIDAPARSTTLSSSAAELGVRRRARSRAPVIMLSAGVVLALLAGGGITLLRRNASEADGPVLPVARPAPEPEPTVVVAPAATADAASPAAIEPQTVSVTVTSAPAGADVIVDGEVRGQTPLVMHLPRADGEIELVLKLEGYRDKSKVVRTSRDSELEVMLEKSSRHRRPPRSEETPAEEPRKPAKPAGDEEILPPTF